MTTETKAPVSRHWLFPNEKIAATHVPIIAVSLLSGGLDSCVVTTLAAQACSSVQALSINYGQRHSKEILHARRIAQHLGVAHQIVDIPVLGSQLAKHSALTSLEHDVPKPEAGGGIPITYVPQRNLCFTAMAAALLESLLLAHPAEQVEGRIYLGPNALDYSGYPDCRFEFYKPLETAIREGSKALQIGKAADVTLRTPIIDSTKAQIVQQGVDISAPMHLTWSCYRGTDAPCGECDSCAIRAKGFAEAGYHDMAMELELFNGQSYEAAP